SRGDGFRRNHADDGVVPCIHLAIDSRCAWLSRPRRRLDDHGISVSIGFHILCNLGMVVGLMPIIGIPLPLMSSGGTSVISMFIGVGLALSVRFRRFVN